MANLKTNPAIHNDESDNEQTTSQKAMLTTTFLLISGLILTSVMLILYGFDNPKNQKSPEQIQAWEQFKLQLTELKSEKKTDTTAPSPDALDSSIKSSEPSIKNWLSKISSGNVRWPNLQLTGFSKGKITSAIINNKQVMEGGVIKGAKVLEIQEYGVLMEYKGETKTLSVEIPKSKH